MNSSSSYNLSEEKIENIHRKLQLQGILGDYWQNFSNMTSLYQYVCERKSLNPRIKAGYGFGTSENKNDAKIAALGEAVERYCILDEKENLFIKGSYKDFKKNAVNIFDFQNFTEYQLGLENYKQFIFDENSIFNWIKGKSLLDNSEILIPAQLVYAEYDAPGRNEPWIRLPISTGAACGTSMEFAIYKGICEIIERDNYLINYLNKISPPIIELENITEIDSILKEIKNKNLEIYCLDMTLDLKTTSIAVLILDKSGNGPAVNLGLGCDLNPEIAIKRALMESYSMYLSKKTTYFKDKNRSFQIDDISDWEKLKIRTFWNSFINIEKVNFLKSGKKKFFNDLINHSTDNYKDDLKILIKELNNKGFHAYVVDSTTPVIRDCGLTVIKILIPELYPMSTYEKFPYAKSTRLFELPINMKLKDSPTNIENIFWSHPL